MTAISFLLLRMTRARARIASLVYRWATRRTCICILTEGRLSPGVGVSEVMDLVSWDTDKESFPSAGGPKGGGGDLSSNAAAPATWPGSAPFPPRPAAAPLPLGLPRGGRGPFWCVTPCPIVSCIRFL